MPATKTRKPLQTSVHGMCVVRDGFVVLSTTGITQAENDKLGVVLLALNTLDLSDQKAHKALVAVISKWPNWRLVREEELVEEPVIPIASPDHQQCTTSGDTKTELWSVGARQYPTKWSRGSNKQTPAAKTRPPLQIYESEFGEEMVRNHKTILSLSGVTQTELKQVKVVLLALNTLNLSDPKARLAVKAVVRTSPTWRAGRDSEWVEASS